MAGSTDHSGEPTSGPLTAEELALSTRNRGMPLEALRYPITPTGLHYLLVHFDIPALDARTWRLGVHGEVGEALEMDLATLKSLPAVTLPVTLECAGNGRAMLEPRPLSQPWLLEAIGTAEWTGARLRDVLQRASLTSAAIEAVFTGADRGVQGDVPQSYARSLTIDEALGDDVLLAYAMNGRPLEPQHGYPVRLIVPGWYGMTSVKWLTSIEAVSQPFAGFQQAEAYRYQQNPDDPGTLVSRIRVRALMVPPGIPEFFSRQRLVEPGRIRLEGRAWSGEGEVTRVEVGIDGEWSEARLEPSSGRYAWRGWSFDWLAETGAHVVSCRATDASGATQPVAQPWNYQGMGNNMAQQVDVEVSSGRD